MKLGEELPDTSAIFDGTTVRLRAARWETLGVIVWRRDETPVPIALAFEGRVQVRTFELAHTPVLRASTRMYGPSRGGGAYPDRLVPATTAGRATLIELTATESSHGTLAVGDQRFDVELVVESIALEPGPGRVWAYYDTDELARASVTEAELVATFADYGVVASPDLGVDDWDRYKDQLDRLPYVPVYLPKDPAAIAREVPIWIDRVREHGRGQLPFAIPIDEPRDDAARARVRELADLVRAADLARAGDDGPARFLFAVTDQPRAIYGDAIDVYLTPHGLMRDRATEPQRWTYNGSPPFAGSMILDTDGVAMRTWGWIGWRWKLPLWYVWDALYWSDRHNSKRVADLAKDATTFDDGEDHGALDGVLVYPDGAPSLRLVALRRGLQDRRLLEAVEACAGRPTAEAIAATIVPTALGDAGKPGDARPGSWPIDEATWEAARIALLDRLAQCANPR